MRFDGGRMIPEYCRRTSLYLEHVARYRFAAALAPGKRVLDAACGTGYGSRILAEAGATEVIGVDLDPEAVDHARERYGSPGVRFVTGDVARLEEIADGTIDLFVCLETVEHVEDGEAVLRAAKRVLTDGGVFLCSTPNWEISRCQNPHHRREYTLPEFRVLLASCFGNVRVFSQRNLLATEIRPGVDGEAGAGPGAGLHVTPSEDDPALEAAPYFLGVATDAALPRLPDQLSLGAAADTEKNHQHIRSLEGGTRERDERIEALETRARELERENEELTRRVEEKEAVLRDLDIERMRREMVLAQRLVHQAIRVNRFFGKVPSRSFRLLRDLLHRGSKSRMPVVGKAPRFSVLVPVHQHFEFLEACIESVLGQTFRDFELVLYDDASPDPRVRDLLRKYGSRPGVKVQFGAENLGISRATNRCIGMASGEHLAFLDCDDRLESHALRSVDAYLSRHPRAQFLYTNRVDVNHADEVLRVWDFRNRAAGGDAAEELIRGMFASHLKVVHRDAITRVGMFREEFDAAQDYDFVLRLSESCRFHFLGRELYRHRIHPGQATRESEAQQEVAADRARSRALLRRRVHRGEVGKLTSIVILSLNRLDDTRRCLRAIRERTRSPHEIVLIDNGSAEPVREDLRRFVAGLPDVRLYEMDGNLGCGGGRNEGVRRATGEYVVFLDNDIEVSDGWLENLLVEMEADEGLAACCCRVLFPDGHLQYNGGGIRAGSRRIRFDLLDTGRRGDDLSTFEFRRCDWVPGGATIYRRPLLERFPYDEAIAGAYEDNDWCLRVRREGYRFGNCPIATVIHHHFEFNQAARVDAHYVNQRYNKKTLRKTLVSFYEKHGVFIDEEDLYRDLGYEGSDEFIARYSHPKAPSAGSALSGKTLP